MISMDGNKWIYTIDKKRWSKLKKISFHLLVESTACLIDGRSYHFFSLSPLLLLDLTHRLLPFFLALEGQPRAHEFKER